MQTELSDFFITLDQSESERELATCLLSFLQNMGADGGNIWFATGVEKDWANSEVTSYPDDFLAETYAIIKTKRCLIPDQVIQQTQPVRWGWDIDRLKYEKESGDYVHSQLSLDVLGLRNALIFPTRTIGKKGASGVSFYTESSFESFNRLLAEREVMFAYASAAAHISMQNLRARRDIESGLSNRETECLLQLSEGLRAKEIASKLNIKEETVHFHVRNAKSKLGAQTQAQAVAIAVLSGLIRP